MLIKVDWNSKKSLKEAVAPKLNDNFWKWFGNSKVVDKDGNPLICYHGTNKNFDKFEDKFLGTRTNADWSILGHFFTPDKSLATKFTKGKNWNKQNAKYPTGSNIFSVFLSIKNPLRIPAYKLLPLSFNRTELQKIKDDAVKNGYDGIIIGTWKDSFNTDDPTGELEFEQIVAFYSNQIKSVYNNGNWSLASDNINEDLYESSNLNDNFWKWFGNSKCVDKDGQPQVCIHRTKADFDTFDISKSHPMNLQGKGFYFSTVDSKGLKQSFGKNIKKCYLSIKNPFLGYGKKYPRSMFEKFVKKEYLDKIFGNKTEIMGYAFFFEMKMEGIGQTELDTTDILIKLGFDGIWLEDNNIWIAFYPNQIKSVDNNGNWSLTSNNINEWWSGGVNWQNDREGLGGVGATMDCHLFFFMFPDQFLNLCPKFSYGDDEFFNQYVTDRKPIGIPFLWCEVDEKNKTLKVLDHEGRHRVKAIRDYANSNAKSQPDIPVAIIYNKDKYRLPVDLTELRKNWKIVGQKGDRTYNVGQFRVQNNLDNARIGLDNLYESIESAYMDKNGNMFEIHKNPSDKELKNLLKISKGKALRVILAKNGDFYVADAYGYDHDSMEDELKIGGYRGWYDENGFSVVDNGLDYFDDDIIEGVINVLKKYYQKFGKEVFDNFIKTIKFHKQNNPEYYKKFIITNPLIQNLLKTELTESQEPNLNQNFWNWFGNSKVVDKQGNPLVVYHGSSKLFNTFKQMKSKSGQLGADLGFWFTDNENIAKQFGNNSFVLDTDKKTYNEYIKSNEYNDKIKELKKKNEITLEDRINLYKDIVDKDEITNDELEYLKNIPLLKIEDIKEKKYRAVYQIYNNNLKYYKEDLKALNNEIKRYFSNNKDKPTIYSCYLSIQNPLVVKGEDIGVSWQRYSVISSAIDEGYDGVIIIDGDTGAGLSNEYIVFNPNQIKSVNNNGEWSSTSNNINETLTESSEPNLNQNFWNWFKGSKTVDEQGNPLIFYHGTKQPNITNFKAKYDDGLVFFAYNEEFAKEWASNAPLTPEQEQGVRDFQGSDDLANYRKEVMDRYKRDYGDNWADDDDIRKAAKWEIKEYEKQKYKQMGIEENVIPVYIRATKIFNPARDYSKVIKEISDHWDLDLKADYKQEYNEAKAEYDKVNNVINKWFEEHKEYRNDSVMELEFRKREDILGNALNKFNEVKQKIETRNNHLKRIMSGAWVYFENPETINKIWKLGYDAIELSEHSGVITTLAVREGTNQVKSIFNYGEWGKSNNIMEAGY